MTAVRVDRGNQFRKGHIAAARDLLQSLPECILEADTGLVTGDNDGALDNRRFHRSISRFYAVLIEHVPGFGLTRRRQFTLGFAASVLQTVGSNAFAVELALGRFARLA